MLFTYDYVVDKNCPLEKTPAVLPIFSNDSDFLKREIFKRDFKALFILDNESSYAESNSETHSNHSLPPYSLRSSINSNTISSTREKNLLNNDLMQAINHPSDTQSKDSFSKTISDKNNMVYIGNNLVIK